MTEKIALLAQAFSDSIKNDLTAAEVAEVIEKNSGPAYRNCCATHDFVDSNMNMLEAFQKVMRRDPDLNDDNDNGLMNRAWGVAKENKFYAA